MKHLLILATLLIHINTSAQCNPLTEKMMVIGDSWAFFSWTGNSYNENLDRFGFSDVSCYSTAGLSVNGAEASDYFTDATRVQELTDYINGNPDLEIVHYSLGGNDLLGAWNTSMTASQEAAIIDLVMIDLKNGIDAILAINPNLKIMLSGYDIPNFSETVGALPPLFQPQHPFFTTWDNMGQPTPLQINTMLTTGTQRFIDSVATWQNVSFVNNIGLMQNTYGNSNSTFGTYAAGTVTVPGGLLDKPTPTEALNFGGNDAFHLDDEGYELFIKRHFEEFYWSYFRNSDQSFNGDLAINNGWTTSSTQGHTAIKVGNNASEETKGIISINTVAMPSLKKAETASLFIKRSSLVGTNLINEDLTVSIITGHFGNSENLDADDYISAADETALCCAYGTVAEDDFWLRIDLAPSLLPFINRFGTTQFRIGYESVTDADRIFEFDNQLDNIHLDMTLVDDLLAIEPNKVGESTLLFPNPVNDVLHVKNHSNIEHLTILDLNGRVVYQSSDVNSQINMDRLTNGVYVVNMVLKTNQMTTQKIVKL
jgi:hypothetical protein